MTFANAGAPPIRRALSEGVTLIAGLGYGANGLIPGIVSFALLGLRQDWGVTPAQASLLSAAAGIVLVVGEETARRSLEAARFDGGGEHAGRVA